MGKAAILMTALAGSALALVSSAQAQETPPPSGEPIVSDSQFEQELPPLDPELGRPLEPLEDFAEPPPPIKPEGELIPDAAVPDPALDEPPRGWRTGP